MKQNRRWLEVAEYSTFAGGIASLLYRPVIAASAPLFIAYLWLNLRQRRALDQALQQRIAEQSLQLQEQVASVHNHTVEAVSSFRQQEGQVAMLQAEIAKIEGQSSHAIALVQQHDRTIEQLNQPEAQIESLKAALQRVEQSTTASIAQVKQYCDKTLVRQYQQLQSAVDQLQADTQPLMQSVSTSNQRIAVVEERAAHSIIQRLNPVTAQVQQLQRAIAAIETCLKPIQAIDLEAIQATVQQLQTEMKLAGQPPAAQIAQTEVQLQQIREQMARLDQLRVPQVEETLAALMVQIEPTAKVIEKLEIRLDAVEQRTVLETDERQQVTDLQSNVSELQQQLEDLDHSCGNLHDRIRGIEQGQKNLDELFVSLDSQIAQASERRIAHVTELLKNVHPSYVYELVEDRRSSRKKLMEALDQAQERLILVCPWITVSAVNSEVERKIEAALKRGVCIQIGWGNHSDFRKSERSNELWKYEALPTLEKFAQQCCFDRGSIEFKILGTHEKYLVCDRKFAMLGSHNFLSSTDFDKFEREVGLYTTDPQLIEGLSQRFETASCRGDRPPQAPPPLLLNEALESEICA